MMIPRILLATAALCFATVIQAQDQDLGNLSSNPYAPDSTANPYGAGSRYDPDSINNQYGTYGSPYSSKSATNPYATDAPKLYDSDGNYRGELSSNPYDPDSTSNPYGRYGSPYSPDSINNPYGAGSPYKTDSPNNPYGTGWKVVDPDEDSTYSAPDYSYSTDYDYSSDYGYDSETTDTEPSYEYPSISDSYGIDTWGDTDDQDDYSWDD